MNDNLITVDFNNITILSCDGSFVIMEGSNLNEAEADECILKIPLKMFFEGVNEFLKLKEEYYKRYEHTFCGVAFVTVEVNPKIADFGIRNYWNDDLESYVEHSVYIYEVTKLDIEMEHG